MICPKKIGFFSEAITAATKRVVESGWVVLGPEVGRFEKDFAAYIGVESCVSVGNGTDALELALKALGVKPGSRVATVANAGMYATAAILAIGAEPVFMDVELSTRNVALSEVQRVVAAGAQVVVITHLYGVAVQEVKEIADFCADKGVGLLEDCAQAHGAKVDGQHVGSFGDAASFSFYPTKNLGALGDGGAVLTRRVDVAEKVRLLRQYGWTSKYHVGHSGGRNSRLDEIQAAILMVFLPYLDNSNEKRRYIANRYAKELCHPLVKVPPEVGEESVAHLYVIRADSRDHLRAHLKMQGISSDVHYPIPDHRQAIFDEKYKNISLRNTEILAKEILTIPCYPEMSEGDISTVVTAVNSWKP